ncbi:MAG TPA: very short patch repair endonuclease [Candidatus Sulfotelmatobacter sp.]|nr:very short patch repair endonuclease [Candidatus Sulfotelmatobacter sp.]
MDKISKLVRSRNMSAIRSKNTEPEIIVRKYLFSKNYRYRIHYPINGKPDIVFNNKNIAIFIHGCFWHGHRNCKEAHIPKSNTDFWKAKISKNIKRDEMNYKILTENKWKVFSLYECEIENNLINCIQPIIKALK